MYINYIFNGRSEGQTMEQLKKSSRKVRRPNYQMTRKVSHMPAFIPQSASRSCSFRTLFVTVRSSPPFAWLSSPPVSASPGAVSPHFNGRRRGGCGLLRLCLPASNFSSPSRWISCFCWRWFLFLFRNLLCSGLRTCCHRRRGAILPQTAIHSLRKRKEKSPGYGASANRSVSQWDDFSWSN